jgi:hypothetical protein
MAIQDVKSKKPGVTRLFVCGSKRPRFENVARRIVAFIMRATGGLSIARL